MPYFCEVGFKLYNVWTENSCDQSGEIGFLFSVLREYVQYLEKCHCYIKIYGISKTECLDPYIIWPYILKPSEAIQDDDDDFYLKSGENEAC